MTQSSFLSAILLMALLGIALEARSATAADGAVEINQVQALAGGVTATDGPGFPVTIDTPGSYALTSDLAVSGFDTTGIEVTADDVTLDLRGFTIQGPCPPVGCALGSGAGNGVNAPGTGNQVRNGRVRLFANDGVSIGQRSRVSALMVDGSGQFGIRALGLIDIVDSKAIRNASGGINTGSRSRVHNCVADSNGLGGIVVGGSSIVSDSSTRNNLSGSGPAGTGITGSFASLIQNNVSHSNQRSGIDVLLGSLVIENVANHNSNVGILFFANGLALGNVLNNNTGTGLQDGSYRENVFN